MTNFPANPILPGYYADPSLVYYGGKAYIYATLDPWGGETLGCWESADFKEWTYRTLNWPTKTACNSPTSGGANVWAPSVVQVPDTGAGVAFFMYISVGNEVWVGRAEHPLGPWSNPLGDRPLIPGDYRPGFHMIDAEAFLDEDGAAYLYWGSGLEWKNGRCWAVKLHADMVSFDPDAVLDVTPAPTYFEAPFMVKHGVRYFLMYSNGITIHDTYQVHYAVGDGPLGPFVEAPNSPILVTDQAKEVLSPGHHAVFTHEGESYILYHRHSIPFDPAFVGRQVCVDVMRFTADGWIEKVVPTHEGPPLVQGRDAGRRNLAVSATASSQAKETTGAEKVLEGSYATRWAAATDDAGPWLQVDLGEEHAISRQELRFEYAWKPYRFVMESSADGLAWRMVADFRDPPALGSPILVEQAERARYLRLVFPEGSEASLFTWTVT